MQHTASISPNRSIAQVAGPRGRRRRSLRGFRHYTFGDDERRSTRNGPTAGRRWFEKSMPDGSPCDADRDHERRRYEGDYISPPIVLGPRAQLVKVPLPRLGITPAEDVVIIEGSATDVMRIENSGPGVAVMESA
jgi:hypothetical protein